MTFPLPGLITLDQALEDQKDLDKLCAQKQFRSPEIYWPNDNYGLARIMKLYSGYPENESLAALIPHGLVYDDVVFPGEADTPYPAVLSYPEYRDEPYRRHTGKMVIPSASPFLYALAVMDYPQAPERKGTMFFPEHSTLAVDVDTDWYMLARDLSRLPEEYHPVTVCIHWQDYQRGRHKYFAKRGFPIVSAGHLFDLDFVFRLVHLFSTCRWAASNDVASNLFYAVCAGVPYFLLGERVSYRPAEGHEREGAELVRGVPQRIVDTRPLFEEPRDDITPEQLECAEYYLGKSRFKSPEDLLRDLEMARGH